MRKNDFQAQEFGISVRPESEPYDCTLVFRGNLPPVKVRRSTAEEIERSPVGAWVKIQGANGGVEFSGWRKEIDHITYPNAVDPKAYAAMRWVCDFGVRHTMREECACATVYGTNPMRFQEALARSGITRYAQELSEEQRRMVAQDARNHRELDGTGKSGSMGGARDQAIGIP